MLSTQGMHKEFRWEAGQIPYSTNLVMWLIGYGSYVLNTLALQVEIFI
jgi:hypothetical protein